MFAPHGLFPAPLSKHAKPALVQRVISKFRFLGKFLAKALMDSRTVSATSIGIYSNLKSEVDDKSEGVSVGTRSED